MDISISTFRDNYYEWFINDEGKRKMYNLNLNAATTINDRSETLAKQTDVSSLKAGVYILNIISDSRTYTTKIIKK